ncbi:peptidoglycan D,D-transpeptidase FtsI family protein [Nocardioides lianchengensis]|uniref:Peptidoglycan glycosyltransferase n=1 Tax=Nocardioides lianchengensis TaxID=1045774 RepID=A0A1G6LMS8_9ACTN|nr:penicillin-binding protein 2 [Nocardioides lianchengensis]NYG12504.1 peptidoglycan glycosyltransferase [Nocardioides lianchengensis]SDC44454.1 peptidoglycan glycosyltransferase [Nocardioides lianchengensis]
MNKPIRTISIFCLVLFLALMANATYLQYFRSEALNDRAENQRVFDAAFSRERGSIIVGRDAIAESVPVDDQYEFQRTYNAPFKYAPLTGFFAYAYGASQLERTQNDVLSGEDDRLFVTRLVDLLSNKGTQGGNIRLTIDPAAQDAAAEALSNVPGDVEGSVVALEPKTGKILAMVTAPSYDPNKLASHDKASVDRAWKQLTTDDSEPMLNRGTQKTLPPGSTFKLVTAAAAIEDGLAESADDQVPGGTEYQLPQTSGDTGLIDNEGRSCGTDTIPFTQALGNSCNTTFAQLAVQVGGDKLREQAEAFGFNQDYLEDLRPQAKSVFPDGANEPQTGQAGIGQYEVRATPLQMAMVAAGIANNGVVMRPYVVDEVQSADLDVVETTQPEEFSRAVKSSTAKVLTDLMTYTVNDGTASPAAIPGVQVAGKTGTAQSGQDDVSPYAWFVSFAPADDPEVAVAVMIEKADIPRGEIGGGVIGGPIAKAVMEAVIK